tara:strand:+ start:199 stop:693 length:495 start_codon:yes stop_codon:yes gene_type:complete
MPIALMFFALALTVAVLWRFPEYRLGAIGALVVIAGVFGTYFYVSEPTETTQNAAIDPDKLALRDVNFLVDPRFITMLGQVQNLADNANLLEMSLELRALDCPQSDSPVVECIVIGDDEGTARVTVPPQQLRAFRAVFMLRNLPEVSGVLRWNYTLVSTRAQPL